MFFRGERVFLRVFLAMLIGVACCAPRPACAFVLGPSEWPTSGGVVNVTYGYSNLMTSPLQGGLSNNEVRAAVEEALLLWSSYAPLNFTQVQPANNPDPNDTNSVNIPLIRIGSHDIDGQDGGVLAHAYYPGSGLSGDLHLDNNEAWALTPGGATFDLLEVLVHELGHTLGLDHEPTHEAIMQAFYIGRYHGPGTAFLFDDDIAGIQARYSAGTGSLKTLLTWTGGSSSFGSGFGSNWFGGVNPANNTTADVAVFDNPATVANQPNLTASRSMAGIRFNRGGWTLSGAAQTITLGAMGIDSWGTGVNTVLPSISLAVDSSWNVTANSTLAMNGSLGGAGGLQKIGAGRLRLFGNNTYAGATTVTGGMLEFNGGGVSLGTVTVQNGARVEFTGGVVVNPGTYTTSGTGFFSVVGPAAIDGIALNGRMDVSGALSGAFNINSTSVVNVNAGGSWAAGPLGIGGTLAAPSTAGTLNLNGGAINVASTLTVWSPGTINLTGGSTSGGQILLKGGKLAGSGTIGSAVSTTGGTLQATGSLLLTGGLSSSSAATMITKSGTGTLVVSGNQSYAPGTTLNVTSGAVGFETDPGAGGAYLNVQVNAGTSAYFASSTHVNSLVINGGTVNFGSSAPLGGGGGGSANEVVVPGASAPLDNIDTTIGDVAGAGTGGQQLVAIDHGHDEFGPDPFYALPPMLPSAITAPSGGGNTAAVPEPSTLALALLALGTLAFAHRRATRNRRSQ